MSAWVVKFAGTCKPCRADFHDRCRAHLAEMMGETCRPCPCNCRDERGDLTHAALALMAEKHPDVIARRVRFQETLRRGSLDLHLGLANAKNYRQDWKP